MVKHHFIVRVVTHYVEQQSEPNENRFVFSYTITIENNSNETVQLLRRRWVITDANQKKLVVEGEGVVGEQPLIDAQDQYTYTSGTILETPLGVMEGTYTLEDSYGDEFTLDIKPFLLSQPNILH